jgi:hypothetical protein
MCSLEARLQGGCQGIAALAPCVQAALQWPDPLDTVLSQQQRHTGARGFIRSSTVQNHFAVARQSVVLLLQFLGFHMQRPGNGFWLGFEVQRMAQVNDGH